MTLLPPTPDPAAPGFWATFPDPAREGRYRAAHAADDRAVTRALLAVGGVAGVAFAQTDLEQPAAWVPRLLAARATAVVLGAALLVWLRRPRPVATADRVLFGWAVLTAGWYAFLQVHRPPGHLGPMVATVSSLVITYTILPLPLGWLTAVGAVQFATCLGVAVWVNPVPDPAALRALAVWLAVATALGWVAGRRLQVRGRLLFLATERQAELTAALERSLAEVRTLRGLIRICAWCKGVHTDGEWQQLERYVSAHSHAEFSHGICPACLAERVRPAAPASPGCGR